MGRGGRERGCHECAAGTGPWEEWLDSVQATKTTGQHKGSLSVKKLVIVGNPHVRIQRWILVEHHGRMGKQSGLTHTHAQMDPIPTTHSHLLEEREALGGGN